MNICEIIGESIRAHRKSLGLSQEKLAELCGCSRQYISKIERAHSNIGVVMIERVCQELGIEFIQIFARFNEDGYLVVNNPKAMSKCPKRELNSYAVAKPFENTSSHDLANNNLSLVYRGEDGTLQSVNIPPTKPDIALQTVDNLRKMGYHGEYLNVRLYKMLPELNAVYDKYL